MSGYEEGENYDY